jgi:hypothetical protein
MPYAIETFEGGRRVSREVIDVGEQQAITREGTEAFTKM